MLTDAYNQPVAFQNIQTGFRACGLWDQKLFQVNPAVIKPAQITNFEGNDHQFSAYKNYSDLFKYYTATYNWLKSECCDPLLHGTINTKIGCLLTWKDILTALEAQDTERKQAEKAKRERAARDAALRLERQERGCFEAASDCRSRASAI